MFQDLTLFRRVPIYDLAGCVKDVKILSGKEFQRIVIINYLRSRTNVDLTLTLSEYNPSETKK